MYMWKLLSCVWLCDPHGLPTRLLCPWNSPSKNTVVGNHSLLQGIIPTQGSNQGLLHWQVDSLPSESPGKPYWILTHTYSLISIKEWPLFLKNQELNQTPALYTSNMCNFICELHLNKTGGGEEKGVRGKVTHETHYSGQDPVLSKLHQTLKAKRPNPQVCP